MDIIYKEKLESFFKDNSDKLENLFSNITKSPIDDYLYSKEILSITDDLKNSLDLKILSVLLIDLKKILNSAVGQLFVERMLLAKEDDSNLLSVEADEIYANLDSDFKLRPKHGVYLKPFTPTSQRSRQELFPKVFTKKEILDYGVFGKHFKLPDQVAMSECGEYAWGTMTVPELGEKATNKGVRTKQKMIKSHFDVLPGHILAEACCQAAAISYMLSSDSEEKLYPMLKKTESFEPILVQPGDIINIDAKIVSEERGVFNVLFRAQVNALVTYFYASCSFVTLKMWEKNKGRVKSDLFS